MLSSQEDSVIFKTNELIQARVIALDIQVIVQHYRALVKKGHNYGDIAKAFTLMLWHVWRA